LSATKTLKPGKNTENKYKDEEILAFIKEYWLAALLPPTLREICKGCHISSTSVATFVLKRMVARGLIHWVHGISRSIIPQDIEIRFTERYIELAPGSHD